MAIVIDDEISHGGTIVEVLRKGNSVVMMYSDSRASFGCERQQQDKLPVFPVVCEQCDWRAHDWVRATQSPNESNPISVLTEAAQERVFQRLATDIAEELRFESDTVIRHGRCLFLISLN